MQEHNPYASPTAAVAETDGQSAAPGELAGRGVRLGAALIDAVLLLAILTPLQWFSGFLPDLIDARQHGERLPWSTMALWATIGITLFTALQSWPLHRNGQTWASACCPSASSISTATDRRYGDCWCCATCQCTSSGKCRSSAR